MILFHNGLEIGGGQVTGIGLVTAPFQKQTDGDAPKNTYRWNRRYVAPCPPANDPPPDPSVDEKFYPKNLTEKNKNASELRVNRLFAQNVAVVLVCWGLVPLLIRTICMATGFGLKVINPEWRPNTDTPGPRPLPTPTDQSRLTTPCLVVPLRLGRRGTEIGDGQLRSV